MSASQSFIEGYKFFDQYDIIYKALKKAAEVYLNSDTLGKIFLSVVFHISGHLCGFLPEF